MTEQAEVESQTERTIALAQLNERLRQERETFDQKKDKDRRSFRLRMTMGWIACVMLPVIAAASILVLLFRESFPAPTVTISSATLLAEVVGCFVAIWKTFAGKSPELLEPVTPENPMNKKSGRQK